MNLPDRKSQGEESSDVPGAGVPKHSTPPVEGHYGGMESSCRPPNPPKTDEEVAEILNRHIPSQAEYVSLVHEIFVSLLPTVYTKETLAADPTGHTKDRLQQLRRHSEQIAETFILGLSEIRSNHTVICGRQARKIKFFL